MKFSDDTAILSLMCENTDLSVYFSAVSRFVEWCDLNHLIFITKKTEEMIFDPRSTGDHTPVFIHEKSIKQVCSYKYLGIHMNDKLSWGIQVDAICSCVQQRLYFKKVMYLFHQAVIESIIRLWHYGMVW